MLTRVNVASAILLHGIGKLGSKEDVLALARVLLEPLAFTWMLVAVLNTSSIQLVQGSISTGQG